MKQLLQIITLSFFGLTGVQIILAAGTAVMLFKIVLNKLSGSNRRWKMRKKARKIESNMWAIE